MKSCSFIIPTRNEAQYIQKCMNSIMRNMANLEAIRHMAFEIIVIDNESTDGTADIVAQYLHYGNIRLIDEIDAKMNVSAVRNIAVRRSRDTELLVFIDGDVVLHEEWYKEFDKTITLIEEKPNTIAGKSYGVSPDATWVAKDWYADELTAGSKYIPAGHMIMTRQHFEELDGFDGLLETGEDVDICRRNVTTGGINLICRDLRTYHLGYPNDIKNFFNRERWHGKGNWYPFENITKTNMGRLLLVNVMSYVVALLFLLGGQMILWMPLVVTFASAVMLGVRRAKGIWKYIPSCVYLSGVQLVARFFSLFDVFVEKDSYLLRKG